jgi:hypothetical protein
MAVLWAVHALPLVACGDSSPAVFGEPMPAAATGTLVVGVSSEYHAGTELSRLEVEMNVDDVLVSDDSLQLGDPGAEFPLELTFEDAEDGARLAITLRGYDADDVLRVVRHMETEAIAGETRLARVHLQQLCRLTTGSETEPSAPRCDESTQTCIAGVCGSAYLAPSKQVPYSPDWVGIDCKPPDAGPAEVTLGFGQTDYAPAQDYDVAQLQAGIQGGHHVWFAARVRNLEARQAAISMTCELPALGKTVGPMPIVSLLVDDGDGYCRLHGIRFQVDVAGEDITTFFGQEMKAAISFEDLDGATASDELWVTLSSDTI